MKLSVCYIVRNEAKVLERSLKSILAVADEIIVVDTGSTDETKAIALRYTANVFDFAWADDFSLARNVSFAHATGNYVMWMDADDVLFPQDAQILCKAKGRLGAADVWMLPYRLQRNGKTETEFLRERILKNDGTFVWQGVVHEVIVPHGKVCCLKAAVSHCKEEAPYSTRNLHLYEKALQKQPLNARDTFYYARELYFHGYYETALERFQAFLRSDGWVENKIQACLDSYRCYLALGREEEALSALCYAFALDVPHAEVCCALGYHFQARAQYRASNEWFLRATRCSKKHERGAFVSPQCYDYLPWLEMCVNYARLGDVLRAKRCNDRALKANPTSAAALGNKRILEELR